MALVGAAYLVGVGRAVRRGNRWPAWRSAAFLILGLGSVVVCTMSSLATYDHTVLWALAVQVTLLISIVPVCLALGDPVGLARAASSPAGAERLDRWMQGPIVQLLTFPAVAAVLALITQMVVFFSGLLGAAVRSGTVLNLVYLLVLVVGCLLALPLLGAEMLPDWCTEPIRLLFAALDGLLDAIPGIAVMTTSTLLAGGYYLHARPAWAPSPMWDEHVSGALMLVLSEVVALPLLLILFFRWASTERTMKPATMQAADGGHLIDPRQLEACPVPEPEMDRPWWESESYGRRTDAVRPQVPTDEA